MPTRKCRDNEVKNPQTDRCILINGATYNDVFKHRTKINKAILKRPKLTKKNSPRENAFKIRMRLNEELKIEKFLNTWDLEIKKKSYEINREKLSNR